MSAPSFWQPLPWYLVTPPRERDDVIDRPRLTELVDGLLSRHRVVLVCAPAGYGKTVAARQWFRGAAPATAWLSLDRAEWSGVDVVRGILTTLHQGVGPSMTDPVDMRSGLAEIARIASTLEQPVTVVIDDAHRAAAALADPELRSLLEIGPAGLRFLMVGHGELSAALNRLVVHGVAAVVDGAALAFDRAEIQTLAPRLSAPEAARLLAATRGWPIAVNSAVAGSDDGPITEYVADNILDRLPIELADFVLTATVADRLDPDLAIALSGRRDAGQLLERCLHRSLFLTRFDLRSDSAPTRSMYEWHQLFSERVRAILAIRDPRRAAELDRVAAEHLADSRPLDAVRHAIRGRHFGLAWKVFASSWLALVIGSRDDEVEQICATLVNDLDLDPGQLTQIELIRACCREVGGDRSGASAALASASLRLAELAESVRNPQLDLSHLAAVMLCSDAADELDEAVEAAWGVLNRRPDEEIGVSLHACTAFLAGWTKVRLRSDPVRASQLLDTAVRKCSSAGLDDIARWAAANHAFALAYAGALTRATSVIERWRTSRGDGLWHSSYDSGIEQYTVGIVALWRADLSRALQINAELSPMDSVRGGYQPLARLHWVYAATTMADATAVASAEASLELIPDENPHGVPWGAYKNAGRVRVCEFRGRHAAIPALCAEIGPVVNIPGVCAMLAAVWRRVGRPDEALRWLSRIDMTTAPTYFRAHALFTWALIAATDGESARARDLMEQSLALAVPERVMLPYVENRDEVATSLLTAATRAGPYREFVAQSLGAAAAIGGRPGAAISLAQLTPRERELLGLLRSSLEFTEIAAALGVSLNTVNTHRRSLYRKIGARNRRDAVRLADLLAEPS